MIESLTAASPAVPVVVGVDDPHLLDDLSMFVLQQIVQRGAAKVLLTERVDEPVPVGIQELWKLGQFDRLDLGPLSSDETAALLSATLGGSLDPDTAAGLWQLTRATRCICGTSSSSRSPTVDCRRSAASGSGWASPSCRRAWSN